MKSAYLILDMQNDLVAEDGPNGRTALGAEVRGRSIIANTQRAIAKARAAAVPIIFVQVGFSADYRECPATSPIFGAAKQYGLFNRAGRGFDIHSALEPAENDTFITKHRVSPFYSTRLEAFLRANEIRHVYASGVSTTAVVQATIRDAHDRDFICTVIEDGCAAATREEHDSSIMMLKKFASVISSETLEFPG
ncbi:isochorismatase family cysteine hydrolase [Bradyrhizobium sp. AS23.2]|uniref:isochorismatase family cysteine hydrolase n=1 Tax=Bradyrhizobium sp. AS23.2 TaxID=1680155 RepID=UPI00093BF170|nr:isochorismatase family cysteine hydrolase [Bradyrhizobium sp. AS23.2]OKO81086.1 chloramphenicol resistance protein [Bradyrhizobium sp. AS23.2]